jgi:hypothetical protein
MTTEQAQLLSALQQINQRLGDQQNQITQLQAAQTRVRGESELSGMVPTAQLVPDAIQMANAGNSSSSNSRDPGVTIDTRQIGKPEQFKSDPAEYSGVLFSKRTCRASPQIILVCLKGLKLPGYQCPTVCWMQMTRPFQHSCIMF